MQISKKEIQTSNTKPLCKKFFEKFKNKNSDPTKKIKFVNRLKMISFIENCYSKNQEALKKDIQELYDHISSKSGNDELSNEEQLNLFKVCIENPQPILDLKHLINIEYPTNKNMNKKEALTTLNKRINGNKNKEKILEKNKEIEDLKNKSKKISRIAVNSARLGILSLIGCLFCFLIPPALVFFGSMTILSFSSFIGSTLYLKKINSKLDRLNKEADQLFNEENNINPDTGIEKSFDKENKISQL